MTRNPRLLMSFVKASDGEVRHLVQDIIDGSAKTEVFSFIRGVETLLGKGTEYETGQRANLAMLDWIDEGFKQTDSEKAFEPLAYTVALAKRLGHTTVYDNRFKQMNRLPLNATGEVSLDQWPGLPGQNGGSYVYALSHLTIYAVAKPAQPITLPKGMSGFGFAKTLLALKDTYGSPEEFLLGGQPVFH